MNRYARISSTEKLRMTRDLVKSNNKKIKKALEEIEKMTDIEKDNLEQGVSCSREKIRVLESIREILEK